MSGVDLFQEVCFLTSPDIWGEEKQTLIFNGGMANNV